MTSTPHEFAAISASSSGDNTLVAAPAAGKRIVVLALVLNPAAAVDLTLKSGSTTLVALGGFRDTGEPAGLALSLNPGGYFECAAGEALVLNLDGAVAVKGFLNYEVR